jgi:adenosylcobinamide-GDP ribazoletransferase
MTFASLRLAVGTLTIIPSGRLPEIDRPVAARAMIIAPVAVLPLACAAGLAGWLADLGGLPPLVVGWAMVATLALGTRVMHLDGLADTVDGLGSGWDRERSLAIMARGDVGPMGVVALVITLGLQAAGLGDVVTDLRGALLAGLIICLSRAALLLVCLRGVPPARAQGLGIAVAGSVPAVVAIVVWLVSLVIIGLGARLLGFGVIGPLIGAAAAVLVVVGLVRHCVRRLGGVTGDVMGAAIELTFTIMIIGAAA